jgi:hypothetical protein
LRQIRYGGGYPEHVVPCGALIKFSFDLFEEGHSIPHVAQVLEAHLMIADIMPQEAAGHTPSPEATVME